MRRVTFENLTRSLLNLDILNSSSIDTTLNNLGDSHFKNVSCYHSGKLYTTFCYTSTTVDPKRSSSILKLDLSLSPRWLYSLRSTTSVPFRLCLRLSCDPGLLSICDEFENLKCYSTLCVFLGRKTLSENNKKNIKTCTFLSRRREETAMINIHMLKFKKQHVIFL